MVVLKCQHKMTVHNRNSENSCKLLTARPLRAYNCVEIAARTNTFMLMTKKKPLKKPSKRIGKPLNVWIASDLRDAFEEQRRRSRRNLRQEVSVALEEYLAKHGLWPPAE